MKSPWLKKNPFMSMYLSAANTVAGAARAGMTAEFKRQAATAMSQGMKQAAEFWSGGLLGPPRPRKPRRKAR